MFGLPSIRTIIGAVFGLLAGLVLSGTYHAVVVTPSERHEAAELRDAEWKTKIEAAEAEADEARRSAQTRIDAAEADYHRRDQLRAGQMAALEDAIRKDQDDASLHSGGPCRPALSRGLSRALDGIGRASPREDPGGAATALP